MPSELEETARRRMERLGLKTPEELIEHDRRTRRERAVEHANLPGESIEPHDLDNKELIEKIVHVLNCPMCASMVVQSKFYRDEEEKKGPSK